MLRIFCLGLLIALAGPVAAQPLAAPRHEQTADAVWDVMDMDSLVPILQAEALAEGEEMAATMFQGRGTGRWLDRVRAIHDPARFRRLFLAGMAEALPDADGDRLQEGLAFYRGPLGRRMLALESSARAAMLDGDVEAAARDAFAHAASLGDPRAAQIGRLIEAADLVETNVAGGLNASVAFSRGFQAGGGFPMSLAEGEIIRDAWAQEPQLRADTEAWIGAYLFLAYSSLPDADLDRYIAYAASGGGQALSRLMFAGFDAVFAQTSYDMGLAAAAEIRGRRL